IIREVVSQREASFTALSRQQTGIKLVRLSDIEKARDRESEANVPAAIPEAPSSAAGMSASGGEGGETGADETSTAEGEGQGGATQAEDEDPSTEQPGDDDPTTNADADEGKDDE
ncbi:uncharacterized protein LOC142354958, partial [Convolutriloba macropyga]|uniref:uncharacterized protein LOC142354958 n=1 Tax=Convolutriloba macropyga TaxID=536237 RepID=UPI003F524444